MLTIHKGFQQPNGYFYPMKIFTTISEVRQHVASLRSEYGCGSGFVPTMGALHEGHLSLVRRSVSENPSTGVSIFVNPIQFNNPADLEKYPRTLETDLEMLSGIMGEEDFVFSPAVQEMYPTPENREYRFGPLETVMEGRFRPGHFNGVGIVVSKLFRITEPEKAYFGEKDFQQLAIIRKLVEIEEFPVIIVPCPIVRESDGLAMSSRNVRLTPDHRKASPAIYRALTDFCQPARESDPGRICAQIREQIDSTGFLVTEYVEIAGESDLQPVREIRPGTALRCFVAVQAGEVRLIDNLRLTIDD